MGIQTSTRSAQGPIKVQSKVTGQGRRSSCLSLSHVFFLYPHSSVKSRLVKYMERRRISVFISMPLKEQTNPGLSCTDASALHAHRLCQRDESMRRIHRRNI